MKTFESSTSNFFRFASPHPESKNSYNCILDIILNKQYKFVMNLQSYKQAYQAAHAEMTDLLGKRTALDKRLGQVKNTMEALRALLDVPGNRVPLDRFEADDGTIIPMGISNAIRQVLSEMTAPMSPSEIKAALLQRGFEMRGYANPLAVIYNTLKRLDRQGELTAIEDPTSKVVAYALVREADAVASTAGEGR